MSDSPEQFQPTPSYEELVAQGIKWYDRGDSATAHDYFVQASQASPNVERIWLLRAETSSDPAEATDCLERALAINPANEETRRKLMPSRVDALQQQARDDTALAGPVKPHRFRSRTRTLGCFFAFLIFAVGAFIYLSVNVPISALLTNANAVLVSSRQLPATAEPVQELVLPPTWTPGPTKPPVLIPTMVPAPVWKTVRQSLVRSGPGTTFSSVGMLNENTVLGIVARSTDNKYVQLHYPDATSLAWLPVDSVNMTDSELAALPAVAVRPPATATRAPTARPVAASVRPTSTPVQIMEFTLGRIPESIADCSKPWRVLGTVYESPTNPVRLNGILVRVSVFGRVQGTVATGSINQSMPGYYEWVFNRGSEVLGQIAIVAADGRLRSQPVDFRLTSQCDGASAINGMVIDMVGTH